MIPAVFQFILILIAGSKFICTGDIDFNPNNSYAYKKKVL